MRPVMLLCAVFVCSASPFPHSFTEPVPEANPARPTVSTPATLTPVGYLQFETGSLGAVTSPEFARLEFLVATEPYIHSSDANGQNKQIHPRSELR
jgi:hypothetical protein